MRFRQLILALMCAGMFFSQSCLAAEQKKLSVLRLEQLSALDGKFTLLISDTGAQLRNDKQNIVCTCAAPSWRVVLFDTKRHVGFELDLQRWKDSGMHIADKVIRQKKGGHTSQTKWKGTPATLVTFPIRDADPLRQQYEMLYETGSSRSLSQVSDEIIYAGDEQFTPPVRDFLDGIFHWTPPKGLIVEQVRVYSNGTRDKVLQTVSKTKETIDASQLEYPTKYKKVDSIRAVTNDQGRVNQAAGVIQDLFIGPTEKSH